MPSTQNQVDDYRRSERLLWQHYGLDPTERFVDLDNLKVRLRVTEVGEGDPVLFIPGTGGTGPYWGALVASLKGLKCLLLDRPGWGLSTAIDYDRFDPKDLAAEVVAQVAAAHGLKRIDVVGASIGNAWALAAATRASDLVNRIVLLGGGPIALEIKPPTFIKLLRSPLGRLLVNIKMKEKMLRKQMAAVGHGSTLERNLIPHEYFSWNLSFANGTDSMKNERSLVKSVLKKEGWRTAFSPDELSRVTQPALMIWGTSDPVSSEDFWTRFMSQMPKGRLVTISGAGHIPWLDAPQLVAGEINAFLGGESSPRL